MPISPAAGPRPALSRRHLLALLGAAGVAAKGSPALAAPTVERTVKVAPGLYELVVSTTTNLLHVASAGPRGGNSAKILGLDPRTLELRSTVELGDDPAFGLAVNDRTGMLFGTATRDGKLLAIDLRSGTVKAQIGEGAGAHVRQVVVDEARNRAFVSVFGAREKPSAIWVVDTSANTVSTVITEGLEGGISGLAYDPAGDRLFAAAMQANEVVEVSLARKAGVRRFACGGDSPVNLAYDAAGGRLFCTNQKSGQLSVLDVASGEALKVLETGAGALGVSLSGDGAVAYVANRGAGTVSLVDTRNLSVMTSLETGTHPNTVAVDRRSGLAYVTNKARMAPRGQPPVEDPNGDTVSLIRA
ncbi:40-residue YVTN family beta-propeller repeat-containing protein [Roseomonas rosea]|uniref:40-residue YVTN family beta-propeller repeat-containing protein n=1 Tax=Muricoccus roseus TaxID=198092 RepID=A0A1M6IYK4_9PROT|nr:YncE family protein [Roseomonas rosea]SHJ39462.1 40-residue YVTN family beta-propeller repeat-containing protein [Roseomonas rosea]